MKKLLLLVLLFTSISFCQNKLGDGLWFNWDAQVDSSKEKESSVLDLSYYDGQDNLTMFYLHRLTSELPDTATISAKIIHLINNYDASSTDDWYAADTIQIDSAGLTYGNIALTKGAYHKLKIVNGGYDNTFSLGIYFTKTIDLLAASETPLYDPKDIFGDSLMLWVEGDSASVVMDENSLVSIWYDKSKDKQLGTDTLAGFDFTSGWTVTANATIEDQQTFSATGIGGVYNPILTVGKVYELDIDFIANTTLQIGTTNTTITVFQAIGTATGTYRFIAENTRLYLRLAAEGYATVSSFSLKEVQGNHLVQSTLASRPLFTPFVIDEDTSLTYSAIKFDGSDDLLRSYPFSATQPLTIFAVLRILGHSQIDVFWEGDSVLHTSFASAFMGNSISITSGGLGISNLTTNTFKYVEAIYNGESSSFIVGDSINTGDVGPYNLNGFTLGGRVGNLNSNIEVVGLVLVKGIPTASQKMNIRRYIQREFGILVPEVEDTPPEVPEVPLMGWTDVGYHYGTMAALKDTLLSAGANTYYFHILYSSDLDSLKAFLPLAQSNNIDTWVYLTDQSRMIDNNVLPFTSNYQSWADTIAKLSNVYSNLKGYAIDDFWAGLVDVTTNGYIDTMIIRGKEISPNLLFYAGSYMGELDRIYTEGDFSTVMDGQIGYYPQDSLQILYSIQKNIPHSRVKIFFPRNTNSSIGQYGRVTQTANITNADSITLTFHYADSYDGALTPYHYIQVAIDSIEGSNIIPSASSDFATNGISWYGMVNGTASYNVGEQAMNWTYASGGVWGSSKDVLTVGIKYRVRFRAKSLNSTRKFFPNGYGATYTKIKNPNLTTEYQDYEGTFTAVNTSFILYVEGGGAGEVVTLDDIIVNQVAGSSLSEVWSADAEGLDDSTVTVNLKPFVTGRNSFKVGLGIYEKGAVGNLTIAGFISMVSGYGITIDTNLTTWTDTVSGSFTVTQSPSQGKTLPLVMLLPGDESDWKLFYSDTSSTFESRLRTILNFYPTIKGSTTWWLKYTEPNFYDALKKVYLEH